jgi:hypothetical protein
MKDINMSIGDLDITALQKVANEHGGLKWYAIADSAQNAALPTALKVETQRIHCLLGAVPDSPVAKYAPHLVELHAPLTISSAWKWIFRNARLRPSVSVIATSKDFDALFEQLALWTEVRLPGDDSMYFAFWDPAILGTLIGQEDDLTLHVKGPVLNPQQRGLLMEGLTGWWYWDRAGKMHAIAMDNFANSGIEPVTFTQQQVDNLVEASVPDHVLYYLELNQPLLIANVPSSQRYKVIRTALTDARSMGLITMSDLVNFACVELIYGDRVRKDPIILNLLGQVKHGDLTFRQAMSRLP